MEFNKSRVYTALNADELKIGSRVILGDSLSELREAVEAEKEAAIQNLMIIHGENMSFRFTGDKYHSGHSLAYLIEPPSEEKYQMFTSAKKAWQTIKDHGGWVNMGGDRYLITAISAIIGVRETEEVCIAGKWQSTEYLFNNFVFADDGSPCGELVKEE